MVSKMYLGIKAETLYLVRSWSCLDQSLLRSDHLCSWTIGIAAFLMFWLTQRWRLPTCLCYEVTQIVIRCGGEGTSLSRLVWQSQIKPIIICCSVASRGDGPCGPISARHLHNDPNHKPPGTESGTARAATLRLSGLTPMSYVRIHSSQEKVSLLLQIAFLVS